MKKLVIISLFLLGAVNVHAGTITVQGRTVEAVGCYGTSNVCFATLSGAVTGAPGCRHNQIRWDSTGTNASQMLATFMLAQGAGKTVSGAVDNTACFGSFPKLIWVYSDN